MQALKWVYSGQQFERIVSAVEERYPETYMPMIALFQMTICSSGRPQACVDTLIRKFGTDNEITTLINKLVSDEEDGDEGVTKETFAECPGF